MRKIWLNIYYQRNGSISKGDLITLGNILKQKNINVDVSFITYAEKSNHSSLYHLYLKKDV